MGILKRAARKIFFVGVSITISVGCSPVPPGFVKKQQIQYVRTDILRLTGEGIDARIILREINHDTVTLDDVSINYEVFIEGKPFGSGKDVKLMFRALDTTEIPIPLSVRYGDLFRTTADVAKAIASGKKSVRFNLRTLVTIRFLGIPVEIPHQAEGELPLPEIKLPTVRRK
jgi:hypothetical protein